MATTECHSSGGLNSSSVGELKLYLKLKKKHLWKWDLTVEGATSPGNDIWMPVQ